jgi:hypothetical protein
MEHTSETTFLCALCVIRPPGYLVWSTAFLLGVGSTDLDDVGRYWGQNKAVVGFFNGPAVYVNMRTVLICVFLARVVADQ